MGKKTLVQSTTRKNAALVETMSHSFDSSSSFPVTVAGVSWIKEEPSTSHGEIVCISVLPFSLEEVTLIWNFF